MRIIYLVLIINCLVMLSCKTVEKQTIEIKTPGGSDSIVNSINSKSNLFIHQFSRGGLASGDHIILYRQKNNWKVVVYQTKEYRLLGTTGVFNYKQTIINTASADSILNIFNTSKFLSISKKNEGCGEKELQRDSSNQFIICRHEHTYWYTIAFTRNKETEIKTYNDVFFAKSCCPGNEDREVFIACFNALNNIANSFIKKY